MAAPGSFKGVYKKHLFLLPPNPQVAPGSILIKKGPSLSYFGSILSLVRDEDTELKQYLEGVLSDIKVKGMGNAALSIDLGSKFSTKLGAWGLSVSVCFGNSSSYCLKLTDCQTRFLSEGPSNILLELKKYPVEKSLLDLMKVSEVVLITSIIESSKIEVVAGSESTHGVEVAGTLPPGIVPVSVPIDLSGAGGASFSESMVHNYNADGAPKLPSLIKGYKLKFKNGQLTGSTPVGYDTASTRDADAQHTQQPAEEDSKAVDDDGMKWTCEEKDFYELLYGDDMSAFPRWAEGQNLAKARPLATGLLWSAGPSSPD